MLKKIAAGAAATALALIPAAGAHAATLPAGESFYGFSWDGELFEINPNTGASTSLFTIPDAAESAAADYNPVDGLVYALAPYSAPCELVVIDPNTETSTTIELTLDAGNNSNCRAMAITDDGTIYASLDDENIFTIDGATGDATLVGAVGEVSDITAMAYNDQTDVLYAGADGDGILTINVETGAGLEVGLNNQYMNGAMDFDSNGVLWFTDWEFVYSVSDLGSFTKETEGTIDMGLGGEDDGTESGFIAPTNFSSQASQSGLADTGVDAAPLLGFAALAVLAGGVAVRARRRA